MPLNEPGRWKYFLSHVQDDCSTEALMMVTEWGREHCWLDRHMFDQSTDGMEEGVKGSETFVCILSEGYFKSKFCCDEMRWAFENKKPIVSTHKMGGLRLVPFSTQPPKPSASALWPSTRSR